MFLQRGGERTGNPVRVEGEGEGANSNIENLVNGLMRSFMDLFTGHEFLRMRSTYD